MAISRAAYDASSVDWRRLGVFALKVARQTSRVPTRQTFPVRRTVLVEEREQQGWWFSKRPKPRTTLEYYQHSLTEPSFQLGSYYSSFEFIISRDPNYHARTETHRIFYGLATDGDLFCLNYDELEVVVAGGLTLTLDGEPRISPLTENDVMRFDFYPDHYTGKTRQGNQTTNIDRNDMFGKRLRYHAKGVGLSKALKGLLG